MQDGEYDKEVGEVPAKSMGLSVGLRIGRLRLMEMVGKRNGVFLCKCDCGTQRRIARSYLKAGAHSNCGRGCTLGHANLKHGLSHSPTQASWLAMKSRCLDPAAPGYARYGGRRISICERWMTFDNFYADMGIRPANKTLDRFPNRNGNYEPGNVRWATPTQQAQNTSANRIVLLNGEPLCVTEAARRLGIPDSTLDRRCAVEFQKQYEAFAHIEVSDLGYPPERGNWRQHQHPHRRTV